MCMTSLPWVSPFRVEERGFSQLHWVITSWKPPCAFLVYLRSQRDLKARRVSDLWKGWEQSSPIEHNLNTSPILTTGANDVQIASLIRLAHEKEDKSASIITRTTGGKSNQRWQNGKWQNKKRKNSESPWSLDADLRPERSQNWNRKDKAGTVYSKYLEHLLWPWRSWSGTNTGTKDRQGSWAFSLSL